MAPHQELDLIVQSPVTRELDRPCYTSSLPFSPRQTTNTTYEVRYARELEENTGRCARRRTAHLSRSLRRPDWGLQHFAEDCAPCTHEKMAKFGLDLLPDGSEAKLFQADLEAGAGDEDVFDHIYGIPNHLPGGGDHHDGPFLGRGPRG